MKNLFVYFKGYLKEVILAPLFKLLEALFELLVPLMIANIIDRIIPNKSQGDLALMIFWLSFLAALGVVVAITAQYYAAKAAVGYTRKLTQALFEKVMRLSRNHRDDIGEASLVTRLSSDTYQIQSGINFFLRLFLRAPIIVFGAVIMAYMISPQITSIFLVMVIVLFALVFGISKITTPGYLRLRGQLDRLVALTREQMSGMRVIRAFGRTVDEQADFLKQNQVYAQAQNRVGAWAASLSPLTFLVVNISLLFVIWQGDGMILGGELSQGKLIALVNYLLQILAELIKAAMMTMTLNQSYISSQRVQEIFHLPDEEIDATLPILKAEPSVAIHAEKLSFTYPNSRTPALRGLDFTLESGAYMGVIGGTGAGKSTLVQLLARLREVTEGRLLVFQQGQSPASLREWREWVTLVPQKAQLFKGTIRENLSLGWSGDTLTDEQLWEVLRFAQAEDFVREKPGGLDAEVEAFGRNFSGGQRQRLTIARALLKKSPLLVLDDATSALDYLTEARLLAAIKRYFSETTVVLISQRTRSLQSADCILVLDQGQQVGWGNHESLLSDSEIYRDIHLSQVHGEEGRNVAK